MIVRILVMVLFVLPTACSDQGIEVHDAAVAVPIGDVTAAYFSIENHGESADQLIGVSASVGVAELHRSYEQDGRMRMEPVEAIEVGPGEEVSFEPGGLHVMLFGVGSLEAQDSVRLLLEFAEAGRLEVTAPLRTYSELAP